MIEKLPGSHDQFVDATNRLEPELCGLLAAIPVANRQAQQGYPVVLPDGTASAFLFPKQQGVMLGKQSDYTSRKDSKLPCTKTLDFRPAERPRRAWHPFCN